MKAEISISNLYYNTSLMNYFFRAQATETFEQVVDLFMTCGDAFDAIEDTWDDLDDAEECFYHYSVAEILEEMGREDLIPTEDEDEDEE